jgi:ribosomal-protein-alanine N-acetyltransferase
MPAPFPDDVPVLDAGDYTLRGWSRVDAQDYYAWMADTEVSRYLGRPLANASEAAEEIGRFLASVQNGRAIRWAVEENATGRVVGRCHFFRWDTRNARASVGYALDRAHWGQGVTSRVVHTALEWACGADGPALHRVEAAAAVNNVASTRILEKMGFTGEGVLREYRHCADGYEDFGMYGLLRTEWLASGREIGRAAPPPDGRTGRLAAHMRARH